MQMKEVKLRANRKLKDFYDAYTEKNQVSVFTMAENASQLKDTEVFLSPDTGQTQFAKNPIYKKIFTEKLDKVKNRENNGISPDRR